MSAPVTPPAAPTTPAAPTADAKPTNYMKILYCVAILLVVVGAVNWGATAQQSNLVEMIVPSQFTAYVYYLVAAAGLVVAYGWFTGGIACVDAPTAEKKETFYYSSVGGE
jgi:uncharacterized membrane protein YuzA (DUF378 family)